MSSAPVGSEPTAAVHLSVCLKLHYHLNQYKSFNFREGVSYKSEVPFVTVSLFVTDVTASEH